MSHIVLASASPQRLSLLAGLGWKFDVIPSDVREEGHPELDPLQRARDLARLKAVQVAGRCGGSYVVGCDTLVVAKDGSLLEKPRSPEDVRSMLRHYSDSSCTVHSALCVIDPARKAHEDVSSSQVFFKKLRDTDIEWWVSTDLWRDRSGGFQIDGPGQLLIRHIEGDWTGIVGLPVFLLGRLLEEAGWTPD